MLGQKVTPAQQAQMHRIGFYGVSPTKPRHYFKQFKKALQKACFSSENDFLEVVERVNNALQRWHFQARS